MDRVLSEQKSEAMKKGAQIAKANLLKDIIGVNELKNIDASRTPKRPQPLKQRTRKSWTTPLFFSITHTYAYTHEGKQVQCVCVHTATKPRSTFESVERIWKVEKQNESGCG